MTKKNVTMIETSSASKTLRTVRDTLGKSKGLYDCGCSQVITPKEAIERIDSEIDQAIIMINQFRTIMISNLERM